ncbi:MAG: HEPN domain-containing protein, partial [Candidatus Bipolaricaulaceae bacterium]
MKERLHPCIFSLAFGNGDMVLKRAGFRRTLAEAWRKRKIQGVMGILEEGLRWLDQASADLKTARECLNDVNFYASAFFAQQAAEKALKGFLYAQGYRTMVTHSVVELLEESSKTRFDFQNFLDYEKELDRHYIGSRYPNFYPAGAP